RKSEDKSKKRHTNVMRLLVRRYVTAEQRKRDDFGITEDDVMEIRQDISTLRYELIDILHKNGMKTPQVDKTDMSLAGKKGKMLERRILKDFQIGIVEGIVTEVVQGSKEVKDVFSSIAKAIGASGKNKKEDWNEVVRKSTMHRDPIGSTRASIVRKDRRSLRKHILETANQGLQMDTDLLLQFNPKLTDATKGTRVAYVKFMANALKDSKDGVKIVDETQKSSIDELVLKPNLKSIIKTKIIGVPGAGDTPTHSAVTTTTTTKVDIEEKKVVRVRTPIIEDPNESRSVSPIPPTSAAASTATS
ncbi:Transient receptor potential protein, partial [Pseudolycoriella hygida]